MEENLALEEEVSAVGDLQCLVHIVVGDEDADVFVLESPDDILNLLNGNRVNSGEGLVEHDEPRLNGQAARYLGAATLATGEPVTDILADVGEVELADKFLEFFFLVLFGELGHLEHGADVVLDGHLAEDAGLLWQVSYAQLRATVHRVFGDADAGCLSVPDIVEVDFALVGGDESCGHVERGRLARAVGPEQSDNLALMDINADVVGDRAFAVFFYEVLSAEHHSFVFHITQSLP